MQRHSAKNLPLIKTNFMNFSTTLHLNKFKPITTWCRAGKTIKGSQYLCPKKQRPATNNNSPTNSNNAPLSLSPKLKIVRGGNLTKKPIYLANIPTN